MFGIVFVCVVKLEDRPSVRLEFRECVCVCVRARMRVWVCVLAHVARERKMKKAESKNWS